MKMVKIPVDKQKLTDFASRAGERAKQASEGAEKVLKVATEAVVVGAKVTKDFAEDAGREAKKVAIIAADGAKDGVERVKVMREQAQFNNAIKKLRPVFPQDLNAPNFKIPCMIRVVEYDAQRTEEPACKGSIGFWTEVCTKEGDMDILNIYFGDAEQFGLTFYPMLQETIYYVDPFQRNQYVALDEYFNYLKQARVEEFKTMAKDIGATYLKISLKEERKTMVSTSKKAKLHARVLAVGKAEEEHTQSTMDNSSEHLNIDTECYFPGCSIRVKPELKYYKHDITITELVKRCLGKNAQGCETNHIRFSSGSVMTTRQAIKIDAVLQKMGCHGNCDMSSEVRRENRTQLYYEIRFPDMNNEVSEG